MVEVGEPWGALDEMLCKVPEYYAHDIDCALKRRLTLLCPPTTKICRSQTAEKRLEVKKFAVIIGLFVLTLFYFSDILSGRLLLVERDLTSFFYPFRFIWVETARQGHFPFWNPYIKCGVPLFATIQPAVLYPLSLP